MPAILPSLNIDNDTALARFFMPHQIHWLLAEDAFHAQGRQVFALAEKSIRIGWTFADVFKNVRKRLRFKKRDFLFATKDYPSALEYMRLCQNAAELFNLTGKILSHGEEFHTLPRLDEHGRPTAFTDDVRNQQDIAADYFALRKSYEGNRWVFSEGRNALNPACHCDIAWAGALATHAHLSDRSAAGGMVA